MWNLDSPEGGLHLRSFQRQEQKIDTLGISKTIQSCQDEEYIRATSRNVKPFKNIRSTKKIDYLSFDYLPNYTCYLFVSFR